MIIPTQHNQHYTAVVVQQVDNEQNFARMGHIQRNNTILERQQSNRHTCRFETFNRCRCLSMNPFRLLRHLHPSQHRRQSLMVTEG